MEEASAEHRAVGRVPVVEEFRKVVGEAARTMGSCSSGRMQSAGIMT